MEISFASPLLQALCEQSKLAQKKLGADTANMLRKRLADVGAAKSVATLPAGKPHPLKGDRKGQYGVWLAAGNRLCLAPDHDPVPQLVAGGIDWSSVTKVIVTFIGNYHD